MTINAKAKPHQLQTWADGTRHSRAENSLIWSDEFNGSGLPSSATWWFEEGLIRNNEAQYYTVDRVENAVVSGGTLKIIARNESYLGSSYTSASLRSQGLKEFGYGKLVIRSKLPVGNGTWPAHWMMGINGAWPARGEVDIMEYVGFESNLVHSNIFTTNIQAGQHFSNNTVSDVTAWHDYWLEWWPHKLVFGIDGTTWHTYNNPNTGVADWPFNDRMYMILNLAIGGDWGGLNGINNGLFPHTMEVEYVRHYSLW